MQPKPNKCDEYNKADHTVTVGFLVLTIMVIAGYKKESYSQTPAGEGVCDLLNDKSVTKGLYNLCLAFCGEQDFLSSELPLMEEKKERMVMAHGHG